MALKVLIVDGDSLARRVLELHFQREPRLRALEPVIVHASDGQRGLELAAAERPDLVIADLLMPRMDGFAFCAALRAAPHGAAVPLVLVSGIHRDPSFAAKLLDGVGGKFLAKPIQGRELADAVIEVLGARRSQVPPAPIEPESGSLAERMLPRLLLEYRERGVTGTLRLQRGRICKDIFLADGVPVGADSNLRQEALGFFLVARRVIDERQLDYLLGEAKRRGEKLGAVLVDLGWCTAEEVLRHLDGQSRMRIARSLRWNDGTWRFQPGRSFGGHTVTGPMDVEPLVFAGLRQSAGVEALLADWTPQAARPVLLMPRLQRFSGSFEATFGLEVLSTLAQRPTIGTLLRRADRDSVLPAVDALLVTGLAELGEPVVAEAGAVGDAGPGPVDEPLSLALLGSEQALSDSDAVDALIDTVFSGGPSTPRHTVDAESAADRDEARDEGAAAEAEFDAVESGIITLPPVEPGQAGSSATERQEKKRLLLHTYLQLHSKTLYEILGVAADADTRAIAAAGERSAARWAPEEFADVDLGSHGPKLDEIRAVQRNATEVLTDPERRRAYDVELARRGVSGAAIDAELAFRAGLALLDEGKVKEATARFETATQGRPDQAAYYAYLGWGRFLSLGDEGGDAAAQLPLRHALSLDPDLPEAHDFFGRVAARSGQDDLAERHLRRALDLDPRRTAALEVLVELYRSGKRTDALEKLYRRVIHRLGESDLELRRTLWNRLGDLYARELRDNASAQIAYEAAARLASRDAVTRGKAIESPQTDPDAWRQTARGLAAEWKLQPTDPRPGHALVDLFLGLGRRDAAGIVAAALAVRGVSSPRLAELLAQHRPKTLPRITRPLDGAVLAHVRHAAEDGDLDAILGLLATEGVLPPFSLAELDLGPDTQIARSELSDVFSRTLWQVSTVLGVEPPPVHRRMDLEREARIADVRPYLLVVGPDLLRCDDRIELGFRFGRALAFGGAGRVAGTARPGRLLRSYLAAALSLAGRAPENNALTVEACQRLARIAPEAKLRLQKLAARVLRERPALNLTAWARALGRTATRVGLLICGDVFRVAGAVTAEEGPEAADDLIGFAISPEYLDLRKQLGGPRSPGTVPPTVGRAPVAG